MHNVNVGRRTQIIEVRHDEGIKILKKLKRHKKLYDNLEIDVDTSIKPKVINYKNGKDKEVPRMKITASYDIKTKGTN